MTFVVDGQTFVNLDSATAWLDWLWAVTMIVMVFLARWWREEA